MYYDIDTAESKLGVGDAVWMYNPQRKKGLSPKLQKPWQGPYVIVKRINDLIYRLQLGPRSRQRVVDFNQLWKYHGENSPHWLITTGSNPTEAMKSIGTSSNDKVQSDVGALDTSSQENEAMGNTTTSGIAASVPSVSESAPWRSSRLRRRPERYGNGHLGQATLKEGAV